MRLQHKEAEIAYAFELLRTTRVEGTTLEQLLRRPEVEWSEVTAREPRLAEVSREATMQVTCDLKYEGYASRQSEQNRTVAKRNALRIPDGLDYLRIAGLRSETRQKLAAARPVSLGQAARISGITPTDIAIISIWLTKNTLELPST